MVFEAHGIRVQEFAGGGAAEGCCRCVAVCRLISCTVHLHHVVRVWPSSIDVQFSDLQRLNVDMASLYVIETLNKEWNKQMDSETLLSHFGE